MFDKNAVTTILPHIFWQTGQINVDVLPVLIEIIFSAQTGQG